MDHIEPDEEHEHERSMPGGGWLSGPGYTPPPPPPTVATVVRSGVAALQAFGGTLDRETAATLLSMWQRRHDLSPAQRTQVLDAFPASIEDERDEQ